MMFTPHQADAVRRALRKGLDQEGPPSQGLDGRLRDALADKGRARFTADQKDDVRSALRTVDEEKELRDVNFKEPSASRIFHVGHREGEAVGRRAHVAGVLLVGDPERGREVGAVVGTSLLVHSGQDRGPSF